MRSSVAACAKCAKSFESRLLSSLLAAVLVVGLLPAQALAASESLTPIPGGSEGAVRTETYAEEGGRGVLALPSDAADSADAGGAATPSEDVPNNTEPDRSVPSEGSDGNGAVSLPVGDIISQDVALGAVVAQTESTKIFFLAKTLESTRTVPVVRAKLPIDTGADEADEPAEGNSSEDEVGADGSEEPGSDDPDHAASGEASDAERSAAASAASTIVGSFECLGMIFAVEPGGESVALVAADYAKLPQEFIEKQVVVIPESVTPDGIDRYSVTRIADDAFASFKKKSANPDYTGCRALFSDEDFLVETGVDPADVQRFLTEYSREEATEGDVPIGDRLAASVVISSAEKLSADGEFKSDSAADAIRTIVSMDGDIAILDDGTTYEFTNPLAGCPGILALSVPASVTAIEDTAFAGFETLQYLVVAEGNSEYASYDGVLYDTDLSLFRFIPEGRVGHLHLASASIGANFESFAHAPSLTTLIFDFPTFDIVSVATLNSLANRFDLFGLDDEVVSYGGAALFDSAKIFSIVLAYLSSYLNSSFVPFDDRLSLAASTIEERARYTVTVAQTPSASYMSTGSESTLSTAISRTSRYLYGPYTNSELSSHTRTLYEYSGVTNYDRPAVAVVNSSLVFQAPKRVNVSSSSSVRTYYPFQYEVDLPYTTSAVLTTSSGETVTLVNQWVHSYASGYASGGPYINWYYLTSDCTIIPKTTATNPETGHSVTIYNDGYIDLAFRCAYSKRNVTSFTIPPDPVPMNSDVRFEGWYFDSKYADPVDKPAGSVVALSKEIVLYAKWEEIPKNIVTWDTFGSPTGDLTTTEPEGSAHIAPTADRVTPPESLDDANNPWVLEGWYLSSSLKMASTGGEDIAEFEGEGVKPGEEIPKVSEDATYVAKWVRNGTLEWCDGTGRVDDVAVFLYRRADSMRQKVIIPYADKIRDGWDLCSVGARNVDPAKPAGWLDVNDSAQRAFLGAGSNAFLLRWKASYSYDIAGSSDAAPASDYVYSEIDHPKNHGVLELAPAPGAPASKFFAGWRAMEGAPFVFGEGYLGQPDVYGPGASVTVAGGPVKFSAVWKDVYTITWEANGGTWSDSTVDRTTSVNHGFPTTKPVDPVRLGYTFLGWGATSTASSNATLPLSTTDAATYYARWKENTYRIKVTAQTGASLSSSSEIAVKATSLTASLPAVTAAPGYSFAGWDLSYAVGTVALGLSLSDATSASGAKVTATVQSGWVDGAVIATATAKAKGNKVTLVWNSHGGSAVANTTPIYAAGAKVQLPAQPKRTGYAFAGWFDAETGGNQVTNDTLLPTSGATYHARWTENVYYIEMAVDTGASLASVSRIEVRASATTVDLPDVTMAVGYSFAGWTMPVTSGLTLIGAADAAVARVRVDIQDAWIDGAVLAKLTATASENVYYIEVAADTGASLASTGRLSVKATSRTADLPDVTTEDGYFFAGWDLPQTTGLSLSGATNASGAKVTAVIQSGWKSDTVIATATAKAAGNKVTLTWNSRGGSEIENTEFVYAKGAKVKLPAQPKRTGYAFAGWFDAETGGNQVTNDTPLPSSDTVYHARWIANAYAITWDPNGGTNGTIAADVKMQTFGNAVKLPPNPTREGYRFQGWFTDTDHKTQVGVAGGITTVEARTAIYVAKWSNPVEGTVTLKAPSGATFAQDQVDIFNDIQGNPKASLGVGGAQVIVAYAVTTKSFSLDGLRPARAGFAFKGWTPAVSAPSWDAASESYVPATYTAVLEESVYSISYEDEKGAPLVGWTDGDGAPSDAVLAASYNGATTPALPALQKRGYSWEKWTVRGSTAPVTVVPEGSGDIVIVAHFVANEYLIEIDLDGGTSASDAFKSVTLTYDRPILTLPSNEGSDLKKPGYAFSYFVAYKADRTTVAIDRLEPGNSYAVLGLGDSLEDDVAYVKAVWTERIAVEVPASADLGILADFDSDSLYFQSNATGYVGSAENSHASLEFVSWTTAPLGIVAVTDAADAAMKDNASRVFKGRQAEVGLTLSDGVEDASPHAFTLGSAKQAAPGGYLSGLRLEAAGAEASRKTFYLGMDFGSLGPFDVEFNDKGTIAKLCYTVAILKGDAPVVGSSAEIGPYDGAGILW